MIKLFCEILIIIIIFVIGYLIRNTIQRNKAIYELKSLGKKYMNIESTKEDIYEWNRYIPFLEGEYLANKKHLESFYIAIKDIFNKYLLYYYPDDYRVDYSGQEKEQAQKNNYRELLLITLNELQFIINADEYGDQEHNKILSLFNNIISSNSKVCVVETKGSRTINELIDFIIKIKKYIHEHTKEEMEWHTKVNKLLKEELHVL